MALAQLQVSQGLCGIGAFVAARAWAISSRNGGGSLRHRLGSHQTEKMNESLALDQILKKKKKKYIFSVVKDHSRFNI